MRILIIISLFYSVAVSGSCLETLKAKEISLNYAKYFKAYRFPDGYFLQVFDRYGKRYEYLLARNKGILKQCAKITKFIIPIKRAVSLSTSHITSILELGTKNSLVGIVDIKHVSSNEVIERFQSGFITEVGYPINVEKILKIGPDLIMGSYAVSAEEEGILRMKQVGLPVVNIFDFLESHPLGRAEWIKFISYFYDKEVIANNFFNRVVLNYNNYKSRIKDVKTRPRVLLGENVHGKWTASSGNSYLAHYIDEANGDYVWKTELNNGPVIISFEKVFATARAVDRWIVFNNWKNLSDLKNSDSKYKYFITPNLLIYNGNKLIGKWGGNDYFETGVLRPDLVLRDFIEMIHPGFQKEYRLKWFVELSKYEKKN